MQGLQDSYNRQIRDQLPEVWEKVTRLRARGLRSASKERPSGASWFNGPRSQGEALIERVPLDSA